MQTMRVLMDNLWLNIIKNTYCFVRAVVKCSYKNKNSDYLPLNRIMTFITFPMLHPEVNMGYFFQSQPLNKKKYANCLTGPGLFSYALLRKINLIQRRYSAFIFLKRRSHPAVEPNMLDADTAIITKTNSSKILRLSIIRSKQNFPDYCLKYFQNTAESVFLKKEEKIQIHNFFNVITMSFASFTFC